MNNNNANNQNQNSGGGRKKGASNKYTPESRRQLLEVFKDKFQRMDKDIAYIPFDERFVKLKPYAKILCNCEDEISKQTREYIFDGIKNEFKGNRFKSYFNQLSPDKKAIELRQYLQMLTPEQIQEIFGDLNKN